MNESVTRTEGFESMLESLENRVSTDQVGYEPDAETALVVPCSMDHRTHCRTLWPVEPTWNVAGVSTLGNQTWERYDGQTVLDGTLEQLVTDYNVSTALVVGHMECDVVTDAYERCVVPIDESPPGIAARLGPLVSPAEATASATA